MGTRIDRHVAVVFSILLVISGGTAIAGSPIAGSTSTDGTTASGAIPVATAAVSALTIGHYKVSIKNVTVRTWALRNTTVDNATIDTVHVGTLHTKGTTEKKRHPSQRLGFDGPHPKRDPEKRERRQNRDPKPLDLERSGRRPVRPRRQKPRHQAPRLGQSHRRRRDPRHVERDDAVHGQRQGTETLETTTSRTGRDEPGFESETRYRHGERERRFRRDSASERRKLVGQDYPLRERTDEEQIVVVPIVTERLRFPPFFRRETPSRRVRTPELPPRLPPEIRVRERHQTRHEIPRPRPHRER